MVSGRIFVITFALILVGAAIASTLVMMSNSGKARANQAGIGLEKLWDAASVWAATHDGDYPDHIALLRKSRYFDPKWLDDPRDLPGTQWMVGGVDARPFMDEEVTLETRADRPPLDRTPLIEAVEQETAQRESSIYFFGDYWFVQLPKHLKSEFLIFGWSQPDEQGRHFVAFDNGEVRRLESGGWINAWRDDAAARAAHGLPPLDMPGN
jgi:hypothetical protein